MSALVAKRARARAHEEVARAVSIVHFLMRARAVLAKSIAAWMCHKLHCVASTHKWLLLRLRVCVRADATTTTTKCVQCHVAHSARLVAISALDRVLCVCANRPTNSTVRCSITNTRDRFESRPSASAKKSPRKQRRTHLTLAALHQRARVAHSDHDDKLIASERANE